MDRVLATGLRALSASQIGLEVTARNVGQSSASGYKREVFSFEAAALGPTAKSQTDMNFGPVVATESPLDLAIEGIGFFQVEMNGRPLFTRVGQFSRGNNGVLVGGSGQVLLDEAGAPISIASSNIEVLANGTVLERGIPVARIALVVPVENATLKGIGGSMFEVEAVTPVDPTESQIRQRALEGSNVDSAVEMTNMMLALRMAEVGARLIQSYDGLIGQAISGLSRGLR